MKIQNLIQIPYYNTKNPNVNEKKTSTNLGKTVSFNGLSALANYNRQNIKYPLPENEYKSLKKQLKEQSAGKNSYKIRKKNLFEGEGAKETLSFFMNALDMHEISSLRDFCFLSAFQDCVKSNNNPKERMEIANSDFLHTAIGFLDSKDCFNLSEDDYSMPIRTLLTNPELLKEYNEYYEDELLRDFITEEIYNYTEEECFEDYPPEEFFEDGLIDDARVVNKFCENEYSKIFYDSLLNRNSDDIFFISQILEKRLQNASEEEAFELYETVTPLLEARTPRGEFVFTSSWRSDANQKGLLGGIENILDAKENDPEKYKKFMKHFKWTKMGRLPGYLLGFMPKKGDTSSIFDEKMKNPNKTDDVVEIENILFYKNPENGSLTPLKISKEAFDKLFKGMKSVAWSQGDTGNCYFVSALYSLMMNPKTRGEIYKIFEQKGDKIIVTIPDSKENPIVYDLKEFKAGPKSIKACLGIQLIEDAYCKTRKEKYGIKGGLEILSGGRPTTAYKAFLPNSEALRLGLSKKCKNIASSKTIAKGEALLKEDIKSKEEEIQKLEKIKEGLDKINPELAKRHNNPINQALIKRRKLVELLTSERQMLNPKYLKEFLSFAVKENVLITASTSKNFNEKDFLVNNHAYAISDIDLENEKMKVINPWNTAFTMDISFDEFTKYFGYIDLCAIQ